MRNQRVLRRAGAALCALGLSITGLAALGVASAQAATTGYQNLSSGNTATTNENCGSLLTGAKQNVLKGTTSPASAFTPGGLVGYSINYPALSSTTTSFAIRDCLVIEDSSGNDLGTLDETEFDNIANTSPFTYQYGLPATFGSPNNLLVAGNKVCNVAKTIEQQSKSASVKNRKTNVTCSTIVVPTLTLTKTPDAAQVNAGDQIGFTINVTDANADATNVTVSDSMPTNTDLAWTVVGGAATAINGGPTPACTITAGALSCATVATLPAGEGFSIHITSPTTASTAASDTGSGAGVVLNHASAGASNAASVGPVPAQVDVTTAPVPSLTLTKTPDAGSVYAGSQIGFKIDLTNTGATTANAVTVSDTMPTNTDLVWTVVGGAATAINGGPTPSCTITSGALSSATVAMLPVNEGFEVHVTSPTTANTATSDTGSGPGVVFNQASAGASNAASVGPIPAQVQVNPRPAGFLTISKTADQSPVTAGDPIGFAIDVLNTGNMSAFGVTVSDTMPTNSGTSWTVDSVSSINGGSVPSSCTVTAGALSCSTVGALGVNQGFEVHVTSPTTDATVGTVTNSASAAGRACEEGCPLTAGPSSASIVVNGPPSSGCTGNCGGTPTTPSASITLAKTADSASVAAGSQIGFTVKVTNPSSTTATGVSISDPLPSASGLSWSIDAANTTAPGCSISGGTLSCGPSSLAAGASEQVHVTSPTTTSTCAASPVTNLASGSATNVSGTQQASAAVDVVCPAGPALSVVKTADANTVPSGGNAGFTVTVSNVGKSTADAVTLDDPLPAADGLSWSIDSQPANGPTCSIASGHLTCPAVSLAGGSGYTVHIISSSAPVDCTVPTVDNTATASASNAASEQGSASTHLTCVLGVVLQQAPPAVKTATPAPSLPFTGFRSTTFILLAGLSLLLGTALVVTAERRPRLARVKGKGSEKE